MVIVDDIRITARKIFEKVDLVVGNLEQRRFFNWINDTIVELRALCPKTKYLLVNENEDVYVESLDDELNINILFYPAIVDNILFLAGAGENYKSEFVRKAQLAYSAAMSGDSKIKIMKRLGW